MEGDEDLEDEEDEKDNEEEVPGAIFATNSRVPSFPSVPVQVHLGWFLWFLGSFTWLEKGDCSGAVGS